MKRVLMLLVVLGVCVAPSFAFAQETAIEYCQRVFQESKKCPAGVCEIQACDSEECAQARCLPKSCSSLSAAECSNEFCELLTDCGGQQVCGDKHYDPPQCGKLAYDGQNVTCCEGFVRRCGIEFFDHSCDMLGENSVYSLPICIPCGDGVCANFENRCNCPEDCHPKGEEYTGRKFEKEIEFEEGSEVNVSVQ